MIWLSWLIKFAGWQVSTREWGTNDPLDTLVIEMSSWLRWLTLCFGCSLRIQHQIIAGGHSLSRSDLNLLWFLDRTEHLIPWAGGWEKINLLLTFNLLWPQQLQRNNHLITLKFSGCEFTGSRCFYSLFLSLSFRVELTRLVSSVLYSCSTLVDHTDRAW